MNGILEQNEWERTRGTACRDANWLNRVQPITTTDEAGEDFVATISPETGE